MTEEKQSGPHWTHIAALLAAGLILWVALRSLQIGLGNAVHETWDDIGFLIVGVAVWLGGLAAWQHIKGSRSKGKSLDI